MELSSTDRNELEAEALAVVQQGLCWPSGRPVTLGDALALVSVRHSGLFAGPPITAATLAGRYGKWDAQATNLNGAAMRFLVAPGAVAGLFGIAATIMAVAMAVVWPFQTGDNRGFFAFMTWFCGGLAVLCWVIFLVSRVRAQRH